MSRRASGILTIALLRSGIAPPIGAQVADKKALALSAARTIASAAETAAKHRHATGATVVFEVVVDDYAEIWVDGHMPHILGQVGGPVVGSFDTPNRVIVTHDATPGQQIQLAIFGNNGPRSVPPDNFIWIKSATLGRRPGA